MIDLELLRVWVYGVGCACIAFTMFCRAVHLDRRRATAQIRLAVTGGGGAAVWALWSLSDGHVPGWPDVALVLAWLAMLAVASRAWVDGLPAEYTRPAPLSH